ncbi:hypothetical protein F3Y22_tig00002237pilonHSYRG00110 [Hibiscus syriacus]|uniref:Calcineurin-like phosphoesterase domain-containing protein n=1 Tax=Hibiscus syriacus TaxID=106335 RepID=A0A6A3CSP9_HIBSY|nr:hypothetical protein F3Y22_tig00002237pilonHSYRG00110 [Hibiscus syriacus]
MASTQPISPSHRGVSNGGGRFPNQSNARPFPLFNGGVLSVLGPKLTTIEHPVKTDGSLSFLVVGDWGRRGFCNQSEVACQMGRIGEKLDIDFDISTVLGNHDYRGNVEAQLGLVLPSVDKRWLCLRSFVVETGKPVSTTD